MYDIRIYVSVGVDESSPYWLGSAVVNTSLLYIGSPGFDPRSDHSFLFLQYPGFLVVSVSQSFPINLRGHPNAGPDNKRILPPNI